MVIFSLALARIGALQQTHDEPIVVEMKIENADARHRLSQSTTGS
jgi:hypothetical protein